MPAASVGRIDVPTVISQRQTFERFLEQDPDRARSTTLIQVVVPSRLDSTEYRAVFSNASMLEKGDDVTKILNVWTKEMADGKAVIHRNPLRPLIEDLDTIPWWDRDAFDMDRLLNDVGKLALVWGNEIMPVYAGRGCPYACTFCANSSWLMMYRGKGRFTRKR